MYQISRTKLESEHIKLKCSTHLQRYLEIRTVSLEPIWFTQFSLVGYYFQKQCKQNGSKLTTGSSHSLKKVQVRLFLLFHILRHQNKTKFILLLLRVEIQMLLIHKLCFTTLPAGHLRFFASSELIRLS